MVPAVTIGYPTGTAPIPLCAGRRLTGRIRLRQPFEVAQEQLPLGRDVQLVVETAAVVLHGAAADPQTLGYGGARMALEHQQHDVALARRQPGAELCDHGARR